MASDQVRCLGSRCLLVLTSWLSVWLPGVMFQSYICPKVEVNHFASSVHGLTNVALETAPPVELILPSFLNWVGSSPLIAHNARFDMRMLTQVYILLIRSSGFGDNVGLSAGLRTAGISRFDPRQESLLYSPTLQSC